MAILLFVVALPVPANADVPPLPDSGFQEPEDSKKGVQTITIAIYLLIALTAGTVSLMLVLMLWGSRVRREARKPLPATKPHDPFWYLKAKKKISGEPEGHPHVSEGQGPSETDPASSG